jgi:macrodomain Ter protein organizer (MatP/YcbG family)
MPDEDIQFHLRLPAELHQQIRLLTAQRRAGATLTNTIVRLLEGATRSPHIKRRVRETLEHSP